MGGMGGRALRVMFQQRQNEKCGKHIIYVTGATNDPYPYKKMPTWCR